MPTGKKGNFCHNILDFKFKPIEKFRIKHKEKSILAVISLKVYTEKTISDNHFILMYVDKFILNIRGSGAFKPGGKKI